MTAIRIRRRHAVAIATLFLGLALDPVGQGLPTADARPSGVDIRPTIDVPAPESFATTDVARRGGIAARIDFVDGSESRGSSAWYRLGYVDGGSRLKVFEHYAATSTAADQAMTDAQVTGWKLANRIVDARVSPPALPRRAHVNTGNDTGYSAGLMIALAYLDRLTPGRLAGNLRIAGSGGIGADGVVMPVEGLDAKVAAAMLTRPDIVFTTSAPRGIRDVTVVESDHTRLPTPGRSVTEQLNLTGFQDAGRVAGRDAATIPVVVVHDIRQALAYLCGYTALANTCALAARAAELPIGAPAN